MKTFEMTRRNWFSARVRRRFFQSHWIRVSTKKRSTGPTGWNGMELFAVFAREGFEFDGILAGDDVETGVDGVFGVARGGALGSVGGWC